MMSSDAFWKFSPSKVYEKSSGRIFTIYASKNEAVLREVQTDFGSSLPARFTEKVHNALSRFLRPITELFAVKVRRILEVSLCDVYAESSGSITTIYVSKNEAVSCEVQTHFGSLSVQAL